MQIERYIAHDGKNIEYLKYEHNNGDNCKKIVLLHGMFESIELYTDFAQYFFMQVMTYIFQNIEEMGN
ncbi:hypothetical protein QQA45_00605 [Sneathia sanguinegens]|uniref:Serine aminopeptidase S33 domain-containing protein n=1 Tax=Sneathia sanguinegens TaxID=40543 RepID=A0ABT7HK32_9FUSO|nr:hypothetical protein [Sneathia sanguinegens]MDK9580031.1 hypothetical protein [Sneathia sanguinegens]